MANVASQVLGKIGAIQTLIENFPMSILDAFGGKTYSGIADFVIDALKEVGVDDRTIIQKLIELVFGVAPSPVRVVVADKFDSVQVRRLETQLLQLVVHQRGQHIEFLAGLLVRDR